MDKQCVERELRIENARLIKLVDTLNNQINSLLYDNRRLKELEEENALLRKAEIISAMDEGHSLEDARRYLEGLRTPEGKKHLEEIYDRSIRWQMSDDALSHDLENIFDNDIYEMMSFYGIGKVFELTEVGFEDDATLETEESLIDCARFHCESYDDRKGYLPIDTVSKAIKYFTENGFKVEEVTKGEAIATLSVKSDEELYNTIKNIDNEELYDEEDLPW